MEDLKKKFKEKIETNCPELKVWGTEANFFLLEFKKEEAQLVHEELLKKEGVATRLCYNFHGLNSRKVLRLAVRPQKEQDIFIQPFNITSVKKNKERFRYYASRNNI